MINREMASRYMEVLVYIASLAGSGRPYEESGVGLGSYTDQKSVVCPKMKVSNFVVALSNFYTALDRSTELTVT